MPYGVALVPSGRFWVADVTASQGSGHSGAISPNVHRVDTLGLFRFEGVFFNRVHSISANNPRRLAKQLIESLGDAFSKEEANELLVTILAGM
jgi:hypothetical protein